MQTMALDFVRRPFPSWPGMLLLAIGIAIAAAEWSDYREASATAANAEQRLRKVQRPATPAVHKKISREMNAQLQDEYRQARQVGEFLLLPWPELFAALETAAMPDIALLAIEPDARKREVRITAEARDSRALFAYVKRLEGVKQLHGVYLLRHELRDDDKQHPVRFTVAALWKEAP